MDDAAFCSFLRIVTQNASVAHAKKTIREKQLTALQKHKTAKCLLALLIEYGYQKQLYKIFQVVPSKIKRSRLRLLSSNSSMDFLWHRRLTTMSVGQ